MSGPTAVFYEADQVRLRPLRVEDRQTSVAWRNDPAIRENILGYRFPVTEEMEADWIDRVLKDQGRTRLVVAIEDKSDDRMIGFVYLDNIDWISRTAEIGMLIGDVRRHRRGLGKTTLSLIVHHAFNVLNLRRLYLRVIAYNEAALRLYRNAGFTEEGRLRDHIFVGDRYHDVIVMGLFRPDYAG